MSVYVHQNISCLQQDSCTITKANMMFTLFPKRYLKQLLWVSENESENWKWATLATSCRTEQSSIERNRVQETQEVQHHQCPYSQLLTAFFATHKCSKMNVLHQNSNTKAHFQTLMNREAKHNHNCDPSAVVRRPSIIVKSFATLAQQPEKEAHECPTPARITLRLRRSQIENMTVYFLKCDKWCRWHVGTCGDIWFTVCHPINPNGLRQRQKGSSSLEEEALASSFYLLLLFPARCLPTGIQVLP